MTRIVGPSAAVLALAAGAVAFGAGPAVAATSCTTMTITGAGASGSGSGTGSSLGGVLGSVLSSANVDTSLTVAPSTVTVDSGGCVTFVNNAKNTVTVTVSNSDGKAITIASGKSAATPALTKPGTDSVSASEALAGLVPTATGSGTITVGSPGSGGSSGSTGSGSTRSGGAGPGATTSGGTTSGTTGSSGTGSSTGSASGATSTHSSTHHRSTHTGSRAGSPDTLAAASIPLLPLTSGSSTVHDNGVNPLVAPGVTGPGTTSTTGSAPGGTVFPHHSALASRRTLESTSGGSRGLPGTIAAVLILGTALGLARVRFGSPKPSKAVDRAGVRVLRRA